MNNIHCIRIFRRGCNRLRGLFHYRRPCDQEFSSTVVLLLGRIAFQSHRNMRSLLWFQSTLPNSGNWKLITNEIENRTTTIGIEIPSVKKAVQK